MPSSRRRCHRDHGLARLERSAWPLLRGERGGGLIEYVICVGLVALVAIAGVRRFGSTVTAKVDAQGRRVTSLEGAGSSELEAAPGHHVDRALAAASAVPVAAAEQPLESHCPGGECSCFVAGTAVATPAGPRPIEALRPGDLVLSRDEATGESAWRPVVQTFVTPGRPVLDVELATAAGASELVGVTPNHRFWVPGRGWTRAIDLDGGVEAMSAAGEAVTVGAISERADAATVFNLEVEGFHTYFVGRLQTLVHNQCDDRRGGLVGPDGRWRGIGPDPRIAPRVPPVTGPVAPTLGPDAAQLAREARARALRQARDYVDAMFRRFQGRVDAMAFDLVRPFRDSRRNAFLEALHDHGTITFREGNHVFTISGGLAGLEDALAGLDERARERPDHERAARLMSRVRMARIPINPQIGAPRPPPLGLFLFGPQTADTGLVWHILSAAGGFVPATPGPPSMQSPAPPPAPPPNPPAIIRRP